MNYSAAVPKIKNKARNENIHNYIYKENKKE